MYMFSGSTVFIFFRASRVITSESCITGFEQGKVGSEFRAFRAWLFGEMPGGIEALMDALNPGGGIKFFVTSI